MKILKYNVKRQQYNVEKLDFQNLFFVKSPKGITISKNIKSNRAYFKGRPSIIKLPTSYLLTRVAFTQFLSSNTPAQVSEALGCTIFLCHLGGEIQQRVVGDPYRRVFYLLEGAAKSEQNWQFQSIASSWVRQIRVRFRS